MTDQELDALARRVLLDSLKADWEECAKPQPPFEASSRYRREVRRMLADPPAWARKRARPMWKRAAQRAAVVLLIVSVGLGSLFAVSPTVKAALLQWVTEWYETHITYRYTGEDMAGPMPRYEITELPEGYAEAESERIDWPGQVDIVYRNEETGETIYLNYMQMCQGSASQIVIEDAEIVPVTVNGLDGQFFKEETGEWNLVTWIDPEHGLHFSIDAPLDKEDILHIAESVSLVESTK